MLHGVKQRITHQAQMSESFILSVFLAFSGGFQDAYTYIVRDHVFANAQTGNVVLMSTHFMDADWQRGLRYLPPLLAFAAGVFVAENVHIWLGRMKRLHWRQITVLLEIVIMLAVGFMPTSLNLLANALVSFACAMQVQTFRTVGGHAYASTMCIGNLRSGMSAFTDYLRYKKPRDLETARCYLGVIFAFAVGAGLGGNLSPLLGVRAIWVSGGILFFSFLLMELD